MKSNTEETMQTLEAKETEKEISDCELERGKPMPAFLHGITQTNILVARSQHNKECTIGGEIAFDLKPKATPDILIFKKRKVDFQRDEKRVSEMPLTAIEILSGTQGMDDFDEKLQRCFDADIQSVRLVQPVIKTIAVFLSNQEPQVFAKADLRDEATMKFLRVKVSQNFKTVLNGNALCR
jgi:Uma2 family endonuclease